MTHQSQAIGGASVPGEGLLELQASKPLAIL